MSRFSTKLAFVTLTTTLPLAIAQATAPLWGQCGGNGWTGATACVSGSTCTFVNEWYSQCLPSTTGTGPSTTTTAGPLPTAPANAKYWFSFGDSYTQTGFDPAGTLPSVGNVFGNPPYPGWTSSAGENWVGYVTTQYNKSLLLTYNYAYGGATIDANLVTPYTPSVKSLTDQVNQYLTGAGTKPASTPWTASNSLFSVWIGINDIGNSWYQSGDRDAFSDVLLNAYFALIQKIYNTGARNFLFLNVPPVDRSPLMLAQSKESQAAEDVVIRGFNTKLAARVNAFKAANSGVTTYIYDSHAQFTAILNSPSTYGFRDGTTYGDAKDIFWLNDLHPGYAGHKLFGQKVREVLTSSVF